MADLRATEMWYGRAADPATEYVDSAAAPMVHTRYVTRAPAPPSVYDIPPLPGYDPVAPYPPPRHFLPPYEYVHERVAPLPPPPYDREIPPYEPPEGMVIPGVQHPDGRFEPHPQYVRRSAPPPAHAHEAPEEPSKHVVELAVPVCCEACKERITNYVGETEGVDSVDCDVDAQKVKVVGELAPADVLQLCKRCFKKSTII